MDAIVDRYIQYGCFGIVVFIVVFDRWLGIPGILKEFREAHTTISTLLSQEISECRSERMKKAKEDREEREKRDEQDAAEREKDRATRHEQAQMFQKAIAEIWLHMGKIGDNNHESD